MFDQIQFNNIVNMILAWVSLATGRINNNHLLNYVSSLYIIITIQVFYRGISYLIGFYPFCLLCFQFTESNTFLCLGRTINISITTGAFSAIKMCSYKVLSNSLLKQNNYIVLVDASLIRYDSTYNSCTIASWVNSIACFRLPSWSI